MALRSSSGKIPEGAIAVNENDALLHQWKIVRSWPSIMEVWPFRLGIPLIGLAGTIGGLTINAHFRRKLKLHRYGKLPTSLAMGLTPAVIISASHCIMVTHEIFLNKSKCLLCLQQKAIILQLVFGFTWPLVLSPLANFMFATRHGTYRLPYWGDYKGTINLWWRFIKSSKEKFVALVIFQACAAAYITYKEKEYLLKIQTKMLILEEEIQAELRAKNQVNQPESDELIKL